MAALPLRGILGADSAVVAAWVEAIGTVAAFVIAAAVFLHESAERRRGERERERERERRQAAQVVFWRVPGANRYVIRNASAEAIYAVVLRGDGPGKPAEIERFPVIPPGTDAEADDTNGAGKAGSTLEFRDAKWVTWHRSSTGPVRRASNLSSPTLGGG